VRKPGRRLNLAARFNLLAISLILATSIGITLYIVREEVRRTGKALVSEGLSIAGMLAQGSEYGIYAEDMKTLRMLLEGLDANPRVAYAAFFNRDLRLLQGRTFRPEVRIPDHPSREMPAPGDKIFHREFRNERDGRNYIDIAVPVISRGIDDIEGVFTFEGNRPKEIGWVRLGLSMEENDLYIRKFVFSTMLFTSLLAVAGIGVTLLVTRRIAAPIQELVEFAHSISEEKLDSRIDIAGTPEINNLANSINQMLTRLKKYRDQAQEHTAALAASHLQETAERKQAEEARDLLSMAVEQAAETIVITDTDGTIQYANPAFERISGFSREEAIGKNPRILKSGRHDRDYYQEMWNTLLRGEVWRGGFINRRKDGSLFDETAVISPVRDAGGRIVNYVAVKRDVTREVHIEEQLRQAIKMEAIGKLAGGIAHDFNNLLTAILGFSDILLLRLGAGHPLRKEVEEIKNAGDRAATLTRQLLAFSRKQVLQPKLVDLNEVIFHMDKMLRRLIGEDIELVTIPSKSLWKSRVDPGQIEQVIMNLAVNARDAMPYGGRLTIETGNAVFDEAYSLTHPIVRPGNYVLMAVSDSGSGMDEETQSRIFDPFFTTKEHGKGTGLGLSTVYGIVKQSKGYVWVYSEVGKGTTFKIYLPQADDLSEAAVKAELPARPAWGGSETVLVAEDEDLVRDLIRSILSTNGYKVLEARDGKEAIDISNLYDEQIHLLLTDVIMPRLSGKELAKHLAEERPGIKVLYMSGYTENAIVHHGVLAPGMEFLPKPFRPDALVMKIREVLDG
jgi:PAS domain S-box-containing protein